MNVKVCEIKLLNYLANPENHRKQTGSKGEFRSQVFFLIQNRS